MHSPGAALAWEFWGRYRWGLLGFAIYVAAYAVAVAVRPAANPETFAYLGSIWFAGGLVYLLIVFSHGSEVRLETADSGFPARLFLLPVRTSVLVGWPMIQGTLAIVLAWVVWDRFVLSPCGVVTPFWWTPMLAAIAAVTQAILWVPFGLPWVRLPVAIVVLTVLVRAPAFLSLAGERFADPDTENKVLTALALVLLPTAYLLARVGVGRARRGDNPDWSRTGRPRERAAESRRERPPFASALRAQVWYEWRLRGFGFVLTVFFTVVFLMACGALLERDDDRRTGFGVTFLFVPILLAGFCGSYAGGAGESLRSLFGMPAFTATRPVSNSAVVAAKLWAAALAAAVTWGMVVGLTLGWMSYTGGIHTLPDEWERATAGFGPARAGVLCALLAVGPVFLIWRFLVENLWVGLTGRVWVGHTAAIVTAVVGLQAMYEWTLWNENPGRQARIQAALLWVAGGAVVLKFLLAGWAIRSLVRRREFVPGAAVRLLGAWCLVAVGLFALLAWLVPPGLVTGYGLALGVALSLPLARLLCAPLALAWNRHR